jgi:hypothetical protein
VKVGGRESREIGEGDVGGDEEGEDVVDVVFVVEKEGAFGGVFSISSSSDSEESCRRDDDNFGGVWIFDRRRFEGKEGNSLSPSPFLDKGDSSSSSSSDCATS